MLRYLTLISKLIITLLIFYFNKKSYMTKCKTKSYNDQNIRLK